MLEVIIDALLDTLKLLPLLLVAHVLIEVFEYHSAGKIKMNKLLSGKFAPLIGGAVGIIPQCGFSVVATNLFAKKHIRLGTLIAVYVATSDEAIPILLSDPKAALKLLPLLAFKLVFAVAAGYIINLILRKNELVALKEGEEYALKGCHGHEIGEHTHETDEHTHEIGEPHTENKTENITSNNTKNNIEIHAVNNLATSCNTSSNTANNTTVSCNVASNTINNTSTSCNTSNSATNNTTNHAENTTASCNTQNNTTNTAASCNAQNNTSNTAASCNTQNNTTNTAASCNTQNNTTKTAADGKKSQGKKFDWKCFVVHPILHTLTVAAYILVVNFVLGMALFFVGEARLSAFMEGAKFLQPALAALVGLIPNCASSVVITQLYASNTLTLGAAFAGLSVNAGLGVAVLFKENKNLKQNLAIIIGMYVGSVIIGTLLTLLPL